MRSSTVITIIFVASSLLGCQTAYDKRIRTYTAGISKDVGAFAKAHQARITKLNSEFDKDYTEANEMLTAAIWKRGVLERVASAQRIADSMIENPDALLRQRFRDACLANARESRQAMVDAELYIASVQNTYAESYAKLVIQTKKLDVVQENLNRLGPTKDQKAMGKISSLIRLASKMFQAYERAKAADNVPPA